jgi:hypothetical protein
MKVESLHFIPPTRVFCAKSVDLVDSKGVEVFGIDKEFVIVSNKRS